VSVECAARGAEKPSFNNVNFGNLLMVGDSPPASHDAPAPDYLQDRSPGSLEPFAFADGALDASFSAPLDFSFDDFIHDDSATVAVDGFGAA